MRQTVTGVALALAVALASCSQGTSDSKPRSVATDSNVTEAAVAINVTGAASINYQGRATIIIYRALDNRVPLHLRLFSVGVPDPGIELRKDVRLRSAFDILGFRGDGSYTIDRTILSSVRPSGVNLPSGIQSNAFVQLLSSADPNPVRRWDVALEPCSVTAIDQARKGSLDCPSLRGDTNATTVSLRMTWDAT